MTFARYLIRRLLTSLGVLLGVVLLTYGLSRFSDSDPVLAYLARQSDSDNTMRSGVADSDAYRVAARSIGADLPPFFFSLSPKHYPDTLYQVLPVARRQEAISFLRRGCTWESIQNHQKLSWQEGSPIAADSENLSLLAGCPTSLPAVGFPRFTWHGFNNGATYFMRNLLRGHLGYSSQTGDAVADLLRRALRVTLPLGLLALFLAVAGGVILGVPLAHRQSATLRAMLYVVVSMPGFWLATLLVTQASGRARPFPGPGWRDAGDSVGSWLHHASLPVIILALPAAAYLALLLAEAMRRGDRLPLRDMARLQGASEQQVWWREMLPLGAVPTLTTAVGMLIPSFLGGFVVVEYVFNIPGLGRLVFESILARDWPLVLGVVLLSGVATILGYVFMDVANALIDPRFRKFVTHAS